MRLMLIVPVLALCSCSNDNNGSMTPGPTPVAAVTQTDSVKAPSLSAPVDVVRDEWGIPHIYGATLPDVAFAEGYVMAEDRLVQMDLVRHNADGTLAEIAGGLSPSTIDGDIGMRVHHLRATAQQSLDLLEASTDPADAKLVATLTAYAAGVNAYLADLRAGRYSLPGQIAIFYDPTTTRPWTEVDSLLMLDFQAQFYFGFDADFEIFLTQLDAKAKTVFDMATDPALAARKGIGADLHLFGPVDPTHTIAGWTGMNGDTSTASLPLGDGNLLALLDADRAGLAKTGLAARHSASNNWVVGPQLSATNHVLVCNDTHVPLQNPALWYLLHLVVSGEGIDAMGVNFAGLPGVALGMNQHVAWGATTSQMDITDVYQESVVTCGDGKSPCVLYKGQKVALMPRNEAIGVGRFGKVTSMVNVTLYDVPHHGPILPRITASHGVEPLGSSELSVRYTGYEPTTMARAALAFSSAKSMKELFAAIDKDNQAAAFNWVAGDDQGHYGWTEALRVPRRAAGHAPWEVLPGDGSAEWGGDMDPRYIPHAYDPAQGFLATANNDPIGITDDDDPFFDEPMVADGSNVSPLYLGFDYADGARVGRITKRLTALTQNGGKVTADDMSSVQADAVSEHAQLLMPTFLDAAGALASEIATPGSHPEVASLLAGASAQSKALVPMALSLAQGWTSFDTPSGAAEEMPSAQQVADSQAATIVEPWIRRFTHDALDDETTALGMDAAWPLKLIIRMSTHPETLKTGVAMATGDALLFDDLATANVIESKRQIAARAILETLDWLASKLGSDPSQWRWGQLHTLTLQFLAPMQALQIPLATDAKYPNGFPRHGTQETPDQGGNGDLSLDDFSYAHGPGIRFVAEMDPAGPRARNVLPGGEVFDPSSPHYKDQLELWRHNKTFDLAYKDADVVASANKEYAAHMNGRVHFAP